MAVVREMMERNEIGLEQIDNKHQLADVLTKKGTPNVLLIDVLKEGNIRWP